MSTLVCPHCGADQHEIEKVIDDLRASIAALTKERDSLLAYCGRIEKIVALVRKAVRMGGPE
jgi:hypothetical protein